MLLKVDYFNVYNNTHCSMGEKCFHGKHNPTFGLCLARSCISCTHELYKIVNLPGSVKRVSPATADSSTAASLVILTVAVPVPDATV